MSQGLVRFGELMGAVNKAAKGRADPQIIKAVIEKLLANEQRD
jgi:Asp-tRNA(Asn)/Glu-tRNA(Gln) amidotransferase B subunit